MLHIQSKETKVHQVQYMYHVVKNTVGMWNRTNRLNSEILIGFANNELLLPHFHESDKKTSKYYRVFLVGVWKSSSGAIFGLGLKIASSSSFWLKSELFRIDSAIGFKALFKSILSMTSLSWAYSVKTGSNVRVWFRIICSSVWFSRLDKAFYKINLSFKFFGNRGFLEIKIFRELTFGMDTYLSHVPIMDSQHISLSLPW